VEGKVGREGGREGGKKGAREGLTTERHVSGGFLESNPIFPSPLHFLQVTMIYDILSPSSLSSSLPTSSSFEDPFCGGGPLAVSSSSEGGKEGGKGGEVEDASALPPIERFYDPRYAFSSPSSAVSKRTFLSFSLSAVIDTPLTPLPLLLS
jgi:hypothetical protein